MNKKVANILVVCAIFAFVVSLSLRYYAQKRHQAQKVKWINPEELQLSPIRTESLSDIQIQKIKRLQQVFAEVDPTPLEKWIEDFRRDIHPDREIQIWETMANAYERYCQSKELSIEAKKEVFGLILMRSGAPDDAVLKNFELKVLTREEAKAVLACYTDVPKPIEVISK